MKEKVQVTEKEGKDEIFAVGKPFKKHYSKKSHKKETLQS